MNNHIHIALRVIVCTVLAGVLSSCRDEAPGPALRPSAQGATTHDDASEHEMPPEAVVQVASALHRSAAAAVRQGDAWAHHRILRGCVTIGGERIDDGLVVFAPERRDLDQHVAELERGCYALRLSHETGSGVLMAVVRDPASGWFLHEVAAGAARADVALSRDEFVPIEIELIVHPRVTRERVELTLGGGPRPLDARFLRQDGQGLDSSILELRRNVYPIPDRSTHLVQRGRFTAYAVSRYDDSDRHRGIIQGRTHAIRRRGGPWILEPPPLPSLIELHTDDDTQIELFVCDTPHPPCDVLPP